ncbi:hypothetical protein PVAND_006364 [Polypedilum vanderplanki]|uniref:Uncharacterized protein n=1 Tax=Polypedilum vanderplanki TaxID=319348 RepID=A0A9J6C3F1_POLVA|nr:hypothetical protein PVAND_006364 [Polypedilum vanderplanki]
MRFQLLALFVLCLTLVVSADVFKPKPYFELIMDRFETIFENKKYFEWNIKIKKINKTTRGIFGFAYFHVPIGNDIKFEGKVLKKQGGEYRYLPYGVKPEPICDLFANDKYIYPDMSKNSDMPADIKNNCPMQPGNYSFNGVVFLLENVPKVILPSGDFANEGIYYNAENEVIGIYRFYGQINNV